jgi:hypothetical protein
MTAFTCASCLSASPACIKCSSRCPHWSIFMWSRRSARRGFSSRSLISVDNFILYIRNGYYSTCGANLPNFQWCLRQWWRSLSTKGRPASTRVPILFYHPGILRFNRADSNCCERPRSYGCGQ